MSMKKSSQTYPRKKKTVFEANSFLISDFKIAVKTLSGTIAIIFSLILLRAWWHPEHFTGRLDCRVSYAIWTLLATIVRLAMVALHPVDSYMAGMFVILSTLFLFSKSGVHVFY